MLASRENDDELDADGDKEEVNDNLLMFRVSSAPKSFIINSQLHCSLRGHEMAKFAHKSYVVWSNDDDDNDAQPHNVLGHGT